MSEERIPTPEEIKEQRQKMLDFYNDNMDFLRTRHEYEKMACELEEFKLRKFMAQIQYADILTQYREKVEPPKPSEGSSRKLRTVE